MGNQNCNATKCCRDYALTCYEKHGEFAKCAKTCVKGIHKDDEAPWNTPWSCNVLKPGVPTKKTAEVTVETTSVKKESKQAESKPKEEDKKGKKGSKCGDVFDKCGGKMYKG